MIIFLLHLDGAEGSVGQEISHGQGLLVEKQDLANDESGCADIERELRGSGCLELSTVKRQRCICNIFYPNRNLRDSNAILLFLHLRDLYTLVPTNCSQMQSIASLLLHGGSTQRRKHATAL